MPAKRELSLFADLDQGRLVQSFLSTLQATLPRFVFGDSIPVSFRPLKSNGNNSVNPWSEVDLTGKTVRIAIGNPAGAASSGTFTLTYGANTTAAIAYNADGATIQTALNALASITAAGGVVVTRATTGAFRIVFNTAGARTAITADAAAIYPTAGVEIHVSVEGDGSTREIVVARIEALAAAYAELTDDFPVAASEIVEVRAGVVGNAAAKAECVLSLGTGSVDADTFSIGVVTFTMKDSPVGENQIGIGVDDTETLANIKAKINAHSTVLTTAEDREAGSLYIRAKTAGTAGNAIAVENISSAVNFGDELLDSVDNLYGGLNYVAPLAGIKSLEFSVLPYSGFYMLEIGGEQTLGIPWDADASTLQAALELVSAVGSGKATVSGDFPLFTINFDSSLGDIGAMTIDMTGLVVPKGRVGTLSTNTAAMIELLNGSSQATAKLEVELYDIGDGTTWTVLQTDCTVIDDVIGNSPETTPAFPSVLSLIGAMIRTDDQGPPDVPQSITITAGAPVAGTGYDPSGVAYFTVMDGVSPTYFGTSDGDGYPNRSGFYSGDLWYIGVDVSDSITTQWENFHGTPVRIPETDWSPNGDGDFTPAESSLDIAYGPQVEAAYIGQWCRVGDAAPFAWYQAETLTSWVNRTTWVIELLSTSGDGLGIHELSINSAGGTSGLLNLYSDSGYRAQIYAPISFTANRTLEAPDNAGTLAIFDAVSTVVPVTGNTLTVPRYQDRFYYINPAGTLATLGLALPNSSDARDGQKVSIFSTQTITALTVSASFGNTMGGTMLAAMVANTLYEFVYSTSVLKWIRVK